MSKGKRNEENSQNIVKGGCNPIKHPGRPNTHKQGTIAPACIGLPRRGHEDIPVESCGMVWRW